MFSGSYNDLTDRPSIPDEDEIYEYTADFITDGTGITIDEDDSSNTITITRDPLTESDIPELSTDKITSGEFNSDRLALGGATGYVLTKTDDGQSWQPISVGGVTEEQVYGHSTNIITNGTGIIVDTNESDNTITISVTNEFTDAHETKLDGIEDGAEANVQPNWNEVDTNSDAFIQNKPTLFSGDYGDLTSQPFIPDETDIYDYTAGFITDGNGITIDENDTSNTITISVTNEFTDAHETKLDSIEDNAQVNIQSDWTETDISSDAFIQNKPTLFSGSYGDLTDVPPMPDELTESDIYDFNLDIIAEGTGIDLVTNDSDNTITISVTNEFTDAHETKLDGIEDGAEVNVKSDWDEVDTNSDAFIQNKPSLFSGDYGDLSNRPTLFSGSYNDLTDRPLIPDEDDIYNYTADFITDGTGITIDENDTSNTITISVTNEFTDAHETKLDGIDDNAQVNVQSDWTEADSNSDAFIQNKPTLFSGSYSDLTDIPSIPSEVTEENIYNFNLDIITEGTGIDLFLNDSDNTITISVANEFTQAHETKLDGIEDNAQVNVQSDWDEIDANSDAYIHNKPIIIDPVQSNWDEANVDSDAFIQNKPSLFSGDYGDLTSQPFIPDEDDIYDYTSSFITDGTGITIDSNDSGNIITITRDPLTVADIPELSTDKITSGEFDSARLALGGATGYVLTKTDDGQSWQPISVGGVTEEQVYGHSTNIITEGSGISVDLNESDNTITISVTNEFTSAHETKLDGIETGAEVNVQSNWAEADVDSDAFIQNKPTITDPVQADWNETNTTDLSFIQNKPSLFSGNYNDLSDRPDIPDENDIYEYTASFITDGTGITIDDDDSGNTITISVTNEFTQAHETKLDGIETGAEVNVQSNWDEANVGSDAFIQNKPILFSGDYGDLTNTPSIPDALTKDDIYDFNLDIITEGTGITIDDDDSGNTITISVTNEFTQSHETKLDGIEDGAEVNVKSDWDEVDTTSDAFIQNKPTLFSGSYNDLTDRPNIADALTEDDIYDFNIDIISEGSGITIDDNDTNNTITISVTNEFTLMHMKLS